MEEVYLRSAIEAYLAGAFFCDSAALKGRGCVFTQNHKSREPYIQIMAYKGCIAVCASPDLLVKIEPLLQGKNRDEIFEFPFIYGQTIYYVPDLCNIEEAALWGRYTYELLQGEEIGRLAGLEGFDNSLVFDGDGHTNTQIVLVAKMGGEIAGLAGAGRETDRIWEVGVDVKAEYRGGGLATGLVNNLTLEIMKQGIVPIYGASITNLASQTVAHRSGYVPCWISSYGNVLDGSSPYRAQVAKLTL